MDTGNIELSLR